MFVHMPANPMCIKQQNETHPGVSVRAVWGIPGVQPLGRPPDGLICDCKGGGLSPQKNLSGGCDRIKRYRRNLPRKVEATHQSISGLPIEAYVSRHRVRPDVLHHLESSMSENEELGWVSTE